MALLCAAATAALAGCAGPEGDAPEGGTPVVSSERFEGTCHLLRVLGTEATPICEGGIALSGSAGGTIAATFAVQGGLTLSFVGTVTPATGSDGTVARIEELRVDPSGTDYPPATLDAAGTCRYSDIFALRFSIYCEATDSEGVTSSAFLVGRRARTVARRRRSRPR